MQVKEIMTTKVISANPEESVRSVILKLRKNRISGVPVVDDENRVVGVFTETDVMNALPDILNDAEMIPLIDVRELTGYAIKKVMTTPVIKVTPETEIKEAAKLILENYVHRLPVVEGRKLVGIVSLGDVLKSFI